MVKVKFHSINKEERYKAIGNFFNVISNLKSKKEITDFFVGLFTPGEALMMARRIQVAQMLVDNESYESICKKLRVSTQTVVKADQWLHKGNRDYEKWIENRLKVKEAKKKYKSQSYGSLLDKYAHHRFLRELLE